MTVTTPTHVDSSIPEVWASRVLREHLRDSFWDRFVGGPGSPIVRQLELLNKPGDKIHIQVTTPLSGAGVTGDTAALEGNEENLTSSEIACVPEVYRHGVRIYNRANKKSILELREEARMRLAEWGREKMDDLRFANFVQTTNLNGATYSPNIAFAGAATALGSITTSTTLSVDEVRKIKLKLRQQKAKPFRGANGTEVYFGVITPGMAYDLKSDPAYNTAVQEALLRGQDNPMFTGALASIDGVVLFEHFNVPTVANAGAGANLPAAKSLFFGREFAVEAVDENVSWAEDTFDYDWEWGVGYHFASQARRALELSSLQYVCYDNPATL